ncbi:MAG TPA: hypothetical protein VN441_03565, partial [Syntrophomonas sp.]|nr:hypothetical protein [Syntrophomonas sp.]
ASMAMAATGSCSTGSYSSSGCTTVIDCSSGNCYTYPSGGSYSQNQNIFQVNKKNCSVVSSNIDAISIDELTDVLDVLVDEETITSDQEDAVLDDLSSADYITPAKLNSRLNALVKDDTLSQADKKAILNSLSDPYGTQSQFTCNSQSGGITLPGFTTFNCGR